MSPADPIRRRERFSHLRGGPEAVSGPEAVPSGPWLALHTALTLSAGHGLFLAFAVTRHGAPGLRELGGSTTAPFVLFFLASIPLALLALALRSRFAGLSSRLQRTLAGLAWLSVAGAFAGYLWRMLGS